MWGSCKHWPERSYRQPVKILHTGQSCYGLDWEFYIFCVDVKILAFTTLWYTFVCISFVVSMCIAYYCYITISKLFSFRWPARCYHLQRSRRSEKEESWVYVSRLWLSQNGGCSEETTCYVPRVWLRYHRWLGRPTGGTGWGDNVKGMLFQLSL